MQVSEIFRLKVVRLEVKQISNTFLSTYISIFSPRCAFRRDAALRATARHARVRRNLGRRVVAEILAEISAEILVAVRLPKFWAKFGTF